jgi:hypothetical protein
MEKELHALKDELKSSHDMCNKQKAEVSRLEAGLGELRAALLTAQSADRGPDDSELKERIEGESFIVAPSSALADRSRIRSLIDAQDPRSRRGRRPDSRSIQDER